MKNIVITSNAFNNAFFGVALAAKAVSRGFLIEYSRNWLAVTETFGLNAASYLSVIVREIERHTGRERLILEELLQETAAIAADDLGLFRGSESAEGKGTIHFRMFERMCDKKLSGWKEKSILPETEILLRLIRESFQSLASGMAVFLVVENIAWNIVNVQRALFEKSQIFQREELGYINLHLQIEGEHGEESSNFTRKFFAAFPHQKKAVENAVQKLCKAFGDFWESLGTKFNS
jgi:hypothetical protein